MLNRLFDFAMRRLIRIGALELHMSPGVVRRYGDPKAEPIRVVFNRPDLAGRFVLSPDMALGEAYMNGHLTVENDDIAGLLRLAMINRARGHTPAIMELGRTLAGPVQRLLGFNWTGAARRNVAHHYDLSSELYDLMLDSDRQYSCAYYTDPGQTLEAAQEAKKHHIAAKLCLRPGLRVLDIGCGWGGMALTLARDYGVSVVGVTLSEEQHRMARERVAKAGLDDRIDIRLCDYRDVQGPFDRIVSVGMFEHVGRPHFREYFRHVHDLLTPDGVALIHTIGNSAPPGPTSSWVRRYIFPGGYIPSMSDAVAAIEKTDLTVTDVEVLRMHYAMTLRDWLQRFEANVDKARALYDERFVRMWRYYLTSSGLSFSVERLSVFQFQIARDKMAVPITRDYLYVAEHAQVAHSHDKREAAE
jgi:cyclopropane-fatty-acyl-phospholipid synthase